ncbi:bifunctional helix-turn-helix domain-containing protein/methylated-DNA--[protein]-cysteine S-methyltransferase [Nereida sp. MMG025]|uniref:methylated-DNA--[protein]-cysteine S-methyltransferase n=1 Tax=Nereida sp. MMG025 TaxID=2909981 RepID=UPI001F2A79E5|nr:bifunctional helix-turn-helix domain-containing protein/methylated-DNA--[protein]-cysteine S-methyltransferase [Nereida sp. MMG025]MCF6444188.1 bifunctional helix-turn-helix domain-containing protein/methylated-DNA--[protein]-cysteine S-methyltransferase [Nereida sp. MMG025]
MRRAIDLIDQNSDQPLALEELAAQMGLSPAHFQRTFSQWAGVSPKRFQQYLTLGHAKSLLSERFTTLETASSVGLSGTSRLHDLFLRWEAMSPGDYARKGAGLIIRWGWFDGPFGPTLAMGTDRGLCGLAFQGDNSAADAFDDMARRWPEAQYLKDAATIAPWVDAALGRSGETRLHLMGAPFQIKVWEALLSIPEGRVTTYGEIAQSIGSPKAVRAVGTAVGRNPIGWLIPCHRALRKTGGLGGYHWGLHVKRAMLAYETAQYETNS